MQPNLVRKYKTLALICLFSAFAGIIFQLISERRLDYNSITVGLPLGLVFGLLELFLLPKAEIRFRRWSFTKTLVFKTILYTAVIYTSTVILALIDGTVEGRKLSEIKPLLTSQDQLILVLYSLVIYSLLVFLLQINQLLGEGILWKFISGKYHKPREEERIFMFLDMKSSTTIAEQLGHVKFYKLLNEIFHEISEPALKTKAEIYQYVGDEVILTWQVEQGLKDSNCIKSFFLFRESLLRNSDHYQRNFGVKPEFKAGLHYGKVVSAQIGDLKREIVYNGDVLNTASRIQNECNRYQKDCLVSKPLMNKLQQMNGFHWERIDTVLLRGKETEVELYSVTSEKPVLAYRER